MNDTRTRQLLTDELDRLGNELGGESADEAARREQSAEEGTAGRDSADEGTEAREAAEGEQAAETLRRRRRTIEEALTRLDEGTYGTCSVCGATIDDERLRARPEVNTCREHA
ncbi:TraR/DksA family transcriptional regulator [Pseudonocardia pini]|uniref:TraR/DksA family transcriptional regulator n=1 Tax=Pseudonocardia pini TaxID=2758030 RepID=UPI0015F0DDBB|nr:TraR/DksA C4-type zinc finger protein [Pseudonocardia pini]